MRKVHSGMRIAHRRLGLTAIAALIAVLWHSSQGAADFGFHFHKSPDTCYQCGRGGGGGSQGSSPQEEARWRSWQLNKEAIDLDRAGRYTAAFEKFREAMNADPTNKVVAGNFFCVKARLEFKDDLDQALLDAQRAVGLEPTAAMVEWLRRFKVQAEIYRRGQATAASRRYAYDLVKQNKFPEAVTILNGLIQQNQNDYWAHRELAAAYFDWAFSYFNAAVDGRQQTRNFARFNNLIDAYAGELQTVHSLNPSDYKSSDFIYDLHNFVIQKIDDEANIFEEDNARKQLLLNKIVKYSRDAIDGIDRQPHDSTNDDYLILANESHFIAKILRSDLGSGAALSQLLGVNENSTGALSQGSDEEAKRLSNCGFDTAGPDCLMAPQLSKFLKAQDAHPEPDDAVVTLLRSIPQEAWGKKDVRIDQGIAWFAALEKQKALASYQDRLARIGSERGGIDPKIADVMKENAKEQLGWIADDEKAAKGNIEQALKDDGLTWDEENQNPGKSGKPLSPEDQRLLDKL